MYRNFICYRGGSSAGIQDANELYKEMLPLKSKIGETYFSPIKNSGEERNFLTDPGYILGNVENFILILTKDFFADFLNSNNMANLYSVTRIEIDCALKNKHIKFIPVIFPDFSWQGNTNFITNQNIIEKIWGNDAMQSIVGAMPIPYVFQYREKVYESIISEISDIKISKKAVVFDFDGTLTKPQLGYNTWETIWTELGYPVEYCEKYHKMFSNKEITHDEWCEITEKYFKERNLTKKIIIEAAKKAELLEDTHETIAYLKSKGILLYILSGSIKQYIELVLGEKTAHCFAEIKANRFIFNSQGKLEGIIGTPYDFEGKARFVNKIMHDKNLSPKEIIYIGNSFNDEFVYETGVETLCINPQGTDYYDGKIWHNYIRNVKNLNEILPFIEK